MNRWTSWEFMIQRINCIKTSSFYLPKGMLRGVNQTESTQVLVSFNDWYRSVELHRSRGCPFCLEKGSPTEEPNVQIEEKKHRGDTCAGGGFEFEGFWETFCLSFNFLEPKNFESIKLTSTNCAAIEYYGIGVTCQCKTSPFFCKSSESRGLNGQILPDAGRSHVTKIRLLVCF